MAEARPRATARAVPAARAECRNWRRVAVVMVRTPARGEKQAPRWLQYRHGGPDSGHRSRKAGHGEAPAVEADEGTGASASSPKDSGRAGRCAAPGGERRA